ncbi:MAG: ABC-F family ATP-binding cassette domain-containing protein [Caulobacter sp.]|nr:ABC-F family ATP-binding cassette domain-containing protein [Caulobacter sp.]
MSTLPYFTLDAVSAATPDGRALFDNLTLAIGRERTGLVGRNGAGKTTLLHLLTGEQRPASGAIGRSGRIGLLRQTLQPGAGATVADLLDIAAPLARLARIEAGKGDEDDLAEADWTLPARVDAALAEVGLAGLALDRSANTLSGGQLTRLALAALTVAEPDVILLDEPTNNLDVEARALVGDFLRRWKGGAVVVSHDRALLRQMDRIVVISGLGVSVYGGGYDLYAERKALEWEAAERDLSVAEREASRVEREAQRAREKKARRDAAGKRYAASGSAPKILMGAQKRRAEESAGREDRLAGRQRDLSAEQLAEASARVERIRALAFDLPSTGLPAGRSVLTFDDVGFGYGTDVVLSGVSLQVIGPERVAVVGPNGSGKSTLIRLASGALEPASGRVSRPVRSVQLDQQAAVLREDETILEGFRRLNPMATVNDAQAALARFLFRNTAAHQAVGSLSGGERLRAALACVLSGDQPPQLLILDEPTNHLDLPSIEAVEQALAGYDGALLVVSHDADFLDAIGIERTVLLSNTFIPAGA